MTVADTYPDGHGDREALIADLDADAVALVEASRLVVRARNAGHALRVALEQGDGVSDLEREEYPHTLRAYRDAVAALPFPIKKEIDHD